MLTLPRRDSMRPTGIEKPPPAGATGTDGGGTARLVSAPLVSTNAVRVGPGGAGGGTPGVVRRGCAASRVNGSSQRMLALVALPNAPSVRVGDMSGVRPSE